MRKGKLIFIIYAIVLLPLLVGSITFFYWYFARTSFAQDVNIDLVAFFTILGYLLLGVIGLVLCGVVVYRNRSNWKQIITPIIIMILTIPAINLYSTLHSLLSEKAFVRIINDSKGVEIERIRSANFERTYFVNNGNDYIVSYYPVYTYNWNYAGYRSWPGYPHEINKLTIELKLENDSIRKFDFPSLSKGDCQTIRLTELMKNNKTNYNNN